MSNFKILGAQRVKALTEMLKEQEAAAVAEITREQLAYEKAEKVVNAELGVQEYVDEIEAMKVRITELSELVKAKTGTHYSVSKGSDYYGATRTAYTKLVDKAMKGDTEKRIAKVRAEYKRKEQQLWLCETLEEAKAIVGIE